MAIFEQYIKKDGTKKWLFKGYIGTDPVTQNRIRTTRRGFKTKKEAQRELMRLQVDLEANSYTYQKGNVLNFVQLYELWFEQHSKDIKPTTIQRIRIYFNNHILKDFGDMPIHKITPLFCQKKLNEWAEKYETYQQMKVYVKMVFKYGMLLGLVYDNPMERTITPKKKRKEFDKVNSYYTKEELQSFLHHLLQLKDQRAYTFFRVLAFTGLRKGEAMGLLWKDISFTNKTIHVNKTLAELQSGHPIIQDTKTESSNRIITIDDQTLETLKEWKNHIIQEKFKLGIRDQDFNENVVFCNSVLTNKNQYLYKSYANNVMKRVKKHFPDMKIIKVHDFRKTNASLLFESGASIKDVSQRLGHKSTKITTDIYIKVTQAKQNETAENFAKYMSF
jgi:integrase